MFSADFQSCPILSNRVHPTKQHSICCRSENCISLERSGQSAVDSIDSFDLSNGKSSLSIRQVRSSIGQIESIRQNNILFVVDRKYAFH